MGRIYLKLSQKVFPTWISRLRKVKKPYAKAESDSSSKRRIYADAYPENLARSLSLKRANAKARTYYRLEQLETEMEIKQQDIKIKYDLLDRDDLDRAELAELESSPESLVSVKSEAIVFEDAYDAFQACNDMDSKNQEHHDVGSENQQNHDVGFANQQNHDKGIANLHNFDSSSPNYQLSGVFTDSKETSAGGIANQQVSEMDIASKQIFDVDIENEYTMDMDTEKHQNFQAESVNLRNDDIQFEEGIEFKVLPSKETLNAERRSRRKRSNVTASLSATLPSEVCSGSLRNSLALVMISCNPYLDFKKSMIQMMLQQNNPEVTYSDIEELLYCYFSLNSPEHHAFIKNAFLDICAEISNACNSE